MPVHDWTRVEAWITHDFHLAWIAELHKALNGGLLPGGYYALAEQHAGHAIADVLTLHASPASSETVEAAALARRRTLAIRNVSGHRLVAILEIVSPANKDRLQTAEQFVAKAVEAMDAGIHLLLVDLLPPGPFDPDGMHGLIRRRLEQSDEAYDLPAGKPLTAVSYAVGRQVEIYLQPFAVGAALPEMPLFLFSDRYVNVPLESTYQEAYRGMPAFWRDVLEGRGPA